MSDTSPIIYNLLALKAAMRLAQHGIRINRLWTNKAMLRRLEEITGQHFSSLPPALAFLEAMFPSPSQKP